MKLYCTTVYYKVRYLATLIVASSCSWSAFDILVQQVHNHNKNTATPSPSCLVYAYCLSVLQIAFIQLCFCLCNLLLNCFYAAMFLLVYVLLDYFQQYMLRYTKNFFFLNLTCWNGGASYMPMLLICRQIQNLQI